MVEEVVKAGDGMEGEGTMAAEPVVAALFLRLKNDLKVLPGEGDRAEDAAGELARAAICFRLFRVQVKRKSESGTTWMPIPVRLKKRHSSASGLV